MAKNLKIRNLETLRNSSKKWRNVILNFKVNLIRVAIENKIFQIMLVNFKALKISFGMRKGNLKQKTRHSKYKIID